MCSWVILADYHPTVCLRHNTSTTTVAATHLHLAIPRNIAFTMLPLIYADVAQRILKAAARCRALVLAACSITYFFYCMFLLANKVTDDDRFNAGSAVLLLVLPGSVEAHLRRSYRFYNYF